MSLFAKLMGNTALSAAAPALAATSQDAPKAETAEGDAPVALTQDRIETALQAAKAEGVIEGQAAGAKAERERSAAVFASDEGKANMTMAAWMLGANPTATADSIVAQLKTMPAAAAPANADAGGTPSTPPLKQQLAATPLIDLTSGKPRAQADTGADAVADTNKMWDEVQGVDASKSITDGGMTSQRRRTGN